VDFAVRIVPTSRKLVAERLLSCDSGCIAVTPRQADRELGEFALFALHLDGPAMLLGHDVKLIERPRPVPSPVGLVVKNGWNSLSRMSAGMPAPLPTCPCERPRIEFQALARSRVAIGLDPIRNAPPAPASAVRCA
jgi:hypothetical protein